LLTEQTGTGSENVLVSYQLRCEIEVFIGSETTILKGVDHTSTGDLLEQLKQEDRHYGEVLSGQWRKVERGRYPDPEHKTPHEEDELYYIISGSGTASVDEETFAIEEGDVVYVEKGVKHDFYDIDDELVALIVFAGGEESVLGRDL
jgi:mannose-1-phosphate guanylyltransferase